MRRSTWSTRNFSLALGFLSVAMGLLFNRHFLQSTLATDAIIKFSFRTALAFGQLFLIGCGLYLVLRRPLITLHHVLLLTFSMVITIGLTESALQLFYEPHDVESLSETPQSVSLHTNHAAKNTVDGERDELEELFQSDRIR